MIWVTDDQGNIQFTNRAYAEFFGVTREEVIGQNWRPLIHPDDAPDYIGSFLASLRSRQPWVAQARVRRADGEWRTIESRSNPRFSASGVFLGTVGSSPDVTERKRATDELREADEQKNRFLTILAHERRNPLAPIRTSRDSEAIRRGPAVARAVS